MQNTEKLAILPTAIAHFEAIDINSPNFDKEIEPLKDLILETYYQVRDVFVEILLSGQRVADNIWQGFLYLHELFINLLKRKEDFIHRHGNPKDPWRAALFNAAADVKQAKVPVRGRLTRLDHRTDEGVKTGEVGEAVRALFEYQNNRTKENAFHLLVELSDTVMNVVQVEGVEKVIGMMRQFQPDKGNLNKLILILLQVAEMKFNFRYLIKNGAKSEEEELEYIEEKLAEVGLTVGFIFGHYQHLFYDYLFGIHEISKAIVGREASAYFKDAEQLNYYLSHTFYALAAGV